MTRPRAVVIPFGVPADGRGLGLGLAALVHSFSHIDGHSVALAQLLARRTEDVAGAPPVPVEAFVPPHAWRDLAGGGDAPPDVAVVVTGAFEPPTSDGRGMLQLLAFDARDGTTRARVEAHLDGPGAGRTILAAFDEVWSRVGGELGMVKDIGDLGWDALESVLRAERCALHDPMRGGPHDRLAAMLHLGRAVGDAPDARFPAGRLASLALEVAMVSSCDPRLAEAALRALARASEDAPAQLELLEARAALEVRLGHAAEAEARAMAAIAQAPTRPRPYAILSEARRAGGDLDGALSAVDAGLAKVAGDNVLMTERGVVLSERGDVDAAERAWREVLAREPLSPGAFVRLAALTEKRGDALTAQTLIDQALAGPAGHPEVLRRAIQLAIATEADGVARAARIASLARVLCERAPADAWGTLMHARALAQMGDKSAAAERLARVESLAPGSVFAVEAQRGRFSLTDPEAAQELDSVLRAAYAAAVGNLDGIAARARRMASSHAVWTAWFAVGIAERRRLRWAPAREAFEATIRIAPGCTPAHMELVGACISLGDSEAALSHARRAVDLEGPTPRSLGVLATALLSCRVRGDARVVITRALALDPTDAANQALAERIDAGDPPPPGKLEKLRDAFRRWRRT